MVKRSLVLPSLVNIPHRTGPTTNGNQCTITRLHSFEAKLIILCLAGEMGTLQYQGQRVSIYPDMRAELRETQTTCNEVRGLLFKTYL